MPRTKSQAADEFKIDLGFEGVRIDLDFSPERKKPAGEAVGVGTRTRMARKSRGRELKDFSRVKNATELIRPLPRPGWSIHAIMGGDFNAWDLVPAIHKLLNCAIAEIYITTLGFNLSNNQELCEMLDAGAVKKASMLCSDYLRDASRDLFDTAKARLADRGMRLVSVRNHSKIILVAPDGRNDRYVVEMSSNLRSCNNIERIVLTNDPRLYEFHKRWIERAMK